MMQNVLFFGNMDAAELLFYIFFVFFLGLVIWLQRESHREGFPLEHDVTGRKMSHDGLIDVPPRKVFHMPFGEADVVTPLRQTEPLEIPGTRRTAPWSGSPLEPTGSGIGIGVGPGAYAQRADHPDLSHDGKPRIVPASATELTIDVRDADPRGMSVLGADRRVAGTVSELWVDRSEMMIRYLEVALEGGGSVLLPMTMAVVDGRRRAVTCSALYASQFAGAPQIATPGQITLLEEEKIVGYFGSGYLYATPSRQEPFL